MKGLPPQATNVAPGRIFTVFLDRDGVFNRAPRIMVRRPAGLRLLPGVLECMARINRQDVRVALCTNQPYVSTGLLPPKALARVHEHLSAQIQAAGGRMDRIEVSTHFLGLRHKPRPGMLQDAGAAFGSDPKLAVMVGDNVKDAQAAAAYGCEAILLATSHSRATLERRLRRKGVAVWAIVEDLPAAIALIARRIEGVMGPAPVRAR